MKDRTSASLPESYLFFDGSFGKVVSFDMILADPDSYSSVFCEGSVALKNILQELWKRGIETRGCCVGHEKVHYYTKTSLFGNKEYIDEETYRAHTASKRYREIETEAPAYIAFRPGNIGSAQDICDCIEKGMQEKLPSLHYVTNAFPDLVTISLDKYVPKAQREQFFDTLLLVFRYDLLHEKDPGDRKFLGNTFDCDKPSLSNIIKSAESRVNNRSFTKDTKKEFARKTM